MITTGSSGSSNIQTCHLESAGRPRIVYDVYANNRRELVILVHGFFNSRKAVLFQKMAAELSKDFDVAVVDLRGHGDSSGLFTWTAKEPDDLLVLIDHLAPKYEKIHVTAIL